MEAAEKSFAKQPKLMKYTIRPGTTDSGKEYEYKMLAMLCLKSLLTEHDMWIASNPQDVGDFDDIVFQLGNVTYLLQLKHQDKPTPLTKAALDSREGKFALVTYLKDVKNLKDSLLCNNKQSSFKHYLGTFSSMYFVIFTNRVINTFDFLEKCSENVLDILNTKSNANVHRVNVSKLSNSPDLEEIGNYNNVYILGNQINVKTIDDKIIQEMEKVARHFKLSSSTTVTEIAEKFIKYVADWAKGNFDGNYLLTKTEIIQKVSELFLNKYGFNFIENTFQCYNCKKKSTWNDILRDTQITLVEDGDNTLNFLQEYVSSEVQKYCASHSNSLWSTVLFDKDRNALYKQHPHLRVSIRKNVKASNIINYFDIYKGLWAAAEIPLLVDVSSTDHYNNIFNILKFSKYYHKVILVIKADLYSSLKEPFEQECIFTSLNDVNEPERNVILSSNVSLQGRASVVLQDLIDNSIFKYIKCKDIIQVLCGSFNIGSYPTPLVDHFIQRKISRIFIKSEVLDQVKDEQFIIEGEPEEELDYMSKPNIRNLKDFDMAPIVERKLTGSQKYANEKQQKQLTSLTDQPVHHFIVYDKNYFEWKTSYGSLKNIKSYVVELEDAEGNDILNTLSSKKTLLCGIPGIGKSILTDYVSQKAPTNKWVIKIDLNAHTEYYKNQKKKTTKMPDHLTYFNNALHHQLNHNAELTHAVFNKFKSSNDIIVLLDGFDEVSLLYEKIVSSIARSFYNAGCHVLITTRPHTQSHLEDEFHCFPVTLKSLTEKDQTEVLSKYFSSKINSPSANAIIPKFVNNLLEAAKRNLNDRDLKFTGIPLLSKLLADVFLDDCRSFVGGKCISNFNFDILYLYRTFIEKKIDIACKSDPSARTIFKLYYKKHHSLFALQLLFPNFRNIVEKLQTCESDLNEKQLKLLQKVGIITIDKYSNINFVHRTFSEYFAAKWLAKNIRSSDKKVKKVAQILIKRRFSSHHRFLFNMFDRIISQDCPLHTDVINGKIREVNEKIKSNFNLIAETDECERSLLHLILLYHNAEAYQTFNFVCEGDEIYSKHTLPFIENFIVNEIEPHLYSGIKIISYIPTEILSNIKPDQLGYTVLDYAIQTFALSVANELIAKTKISYINAAIPYYFKACLKICVRNNYKDLFKTFLIYFTYNDLVYNKVEMKTAVETYCKTYGSPSRLISKYYIRNFQRQKIFKLLESNGNNVFQWYSNRNSNVHYLARFGTKTQILQLLQQDNKVNKSDNLYNNTPLHYAVLRQNEEILDIYLKNNAKLNKKNFALETPLQLAIKYGNSNIIDMVISDDTSIDEQDLVGDTPLHLALKTEKYNIADVLITKGASVNTEDGLGNNALHLIANSRASSTVADIMKAVLPNICDINKNNYVAATPLHYAIYGNNIEAVKLLISAGAKTDLSDANGSNCLLLASYLGSTKIVQELLKTINIDSHNKNEKTALHMAVERNHLDTVKLLISKGASINIMDNDGQTALHIASYFGHTDIVNEILKIKVDIDAQNKDGRTALHMAIQKNHLDVVKSLISKGASINIMNNYGDTTLHAASYFGYIDIVNEILKMKVNIDAQNEDGDAALHMAIKNNHLDVVQSLISKGANINTMDNNGQSPLHIASFLGHIDIVNEILKMKVNIVAQNKNGGTALHMAVENNHLDVVKSLISKGASVNIMDNVGNSGLHSASYLGHIDIVNEILKIKVNIDAQNKDGSHALHMAIRNNHFGIVKSLISKGASIHIMNNIGNSGLHDASYLGHIDIVNELLKMKVNIDAQSKDGITALHMAIENNHLDVVKSLISKGANVNIMNNDGQRALHAASCFGNIDILNEIFKVKVNIDAQSKYGRTALHMAVEINHLDTVKLLISKGASINIMNNDRNSALQLASYFGSIDIVDEILKMKVNIAAQNKNGSTALHMAIENNHLDVVKSLISKDASIHIMDNIGNSSLHEASYLGHIDIVNEILKMKINIDAQSKDGRTALHMAIQKNHLDVVKSLISKGASINIMNNYGDTTLHEASYFGYIDIVNEILKMKVNIDAQNEDGDAALHMAIKNNHLDVVKSLISKGASVNIMDNSGQRALHTASYFGHIDILTEILKMKINVDAQSKDGRTALHMAIENNHVDVVKSLISKGASINIMTNDGNSALHVASYFGHLDIVNEILKMKIDIDAPNKNGRTALHMAIQNNHFDVFILLISK